MVSAAQLRLNLPGADVVDRSGSLLANVLAILFDRRRANGRTMRDGVTMSGFPTIDGSRIMFRQRGGDGMWRMVVAQLDGNLDYVSPWQGSDPHPRIALPEPDVLRMDVLVSRNKRRAIQ